MAPDFPSAATPTRKLLMGGCAYVSAACFTSLTSRLSTLLAPKRSIHAGTSLGGITAGHADADAADSGTDSGKTSDDVEAADDPVDAACLVPLKLSPDLPSERAPRLPRPPASRERQGANQEPRAKEWNLPLKTRRGLLDILGLLLLLYKKLLPVNALGPA